jgi:hypothetical protein
MRGLAVVAICSWSALAVAEPALPVKHLDAVHVSVGNRSQKALALRPLPGGGWRIDLEGDGDTADVIDLTPGTPARTVTLAVVTNTLKFDTARFAPGHVYRVQLNGPKRPSVSLVYLYPPAGTDKLPKKAAAQRLRFEADEAPVQGDGILGVDKGSL